MVLPKIRFLKFTFGAFALLLASIVTTDYFSVFKIRELQSRIADLEREKAEMLLFAERITASRRVAQVTVTEQHLDARDGPMTLLHWQQIGADGVLGPVEVIGIRGTQVYFEALVLKFDYDLIGRASGEPTTNLAMFRRAFGDGQSPVSGHPLDQTAPTLRGEAGTHTQAEAALWKRFWEFVDRPDLAKQYGIRVAQCEAPSAPMRPGQVWEVALDAAGGLNLRLLGERGPASQPSALPGEAASR
ncbi:MAG: hypothetical protein KF841_01645 [Phycisphaerae bacterium]|nr:hypothetical protein [Phycisphaerae bacterium]